MAMARHTHLVLGVAGAAAMPLLMQSGSLASEVLVFALAAMGCTAQEPWTARGASIPCPSRSTPSSPARGMPTKSR